MFDKILIANRGEIACRVIKTAKKMGLTTVAIYSDADAQALHVEMADEAIHIGPPPANQSYIVIDKVMEAIKQSGAQAVHPGYGFLSENSKFAEALEAAGVAFVGPPKGAIEKMGDKITSKKIAKEAGVSTVPGYMGLIEDAEEAVKISNDIGYPVMLKASAGGGGKGMRIAWNDEEAREGFQSSKNEAANSFGDDRIFIEKFVTQPRHIEIQVLCDAHGNGVYLGERECSIQRRNQKVVEEAPSPFLDEATRKAMGEQAVALAQAVGYTSAGTVEFIVDGDKNFYFLEMNTRLQVEHPVTELITGVDLVEQMIRVANGEKLSITQDDVTLTGWAIENRLYAEDPYRGFLPSIGRLTRYRPPQEVAAGPLLEQGTWQGDAPAGDMAVRNDTGVYEGGEISMYYDPMIAKLCTWAPTRAEAIEKMRVALDSFEVEGIGHNLPFLSAVMDHPKFVSGEMTTAFIAEEYPDGFEGVSLPESELRRIAAACAAMHRVGEIRRARVSGRMDNHERKVGSDWNVKLQGENFDVVTKADPEGATVAFSDGSEMRVSGDWTPGDQLAEMTVDGAPLVLKVGKISGGFRIRTRGADLKVHVRTPRQAELAALMPEKLPPDTSKMLLCPMPGLVVKLDVEVGDEVQEGQALCTIEAMKMENILRAEKKGVVSKVNAGAGDSLAVDDVIMEFE
ncbi:acetyl/propionyl/methylcrotonyl-CoA carboxylase subunit alpha [Sulfitobacter sp. KE29]|uniref:acetyl-CoA carboxylase biotin carboxylase subunit n=1 Tax=unclassified Sulfitobacter TaxID=196795 RepID=UPI0007C3028C|nr:MULTISPECIES: acetyl/propionyl/methylcrotonyl-CoA carboxylase subunit alpha [unclassified Sulfitobacter]KZY53585.1 acetyl/propionyl-CoA carboxylase subuit alpha [Sulfitobacter sp. HI0054]MBO9438685.1 acetyl/propionyl/methylcrotonyl-CoA carboxylase subunit alpha [Sulfitobacter sp. R18_2]MDF3417894.1 acetyl/propionyl/methylcrotonyl-CoA carboxylase subunit alpha [Sulfitobacter sp. Ks38]MDF3425376.1 acetyl/propionyl/methylcrotonyl-CoA carboxylase subunit alpha [Sulfitobacter sp. KE29]MDF3428957